MIIPLVAFLLGNFFFSDQSMMIMGMLLIGLIPTSGMTLSWTGFAKGNINGAVKIQVSGLILGALMTPLMTIFIQILAIVIIPLVLGLMTRLLIIRKAGDEKYNRVIKQKFSLILFYLISYLVSIFFGRRFFEPKDQSLIVFGTVMRNLSIALAIAMNVFGKNGSDMALLISIAYVVQVETASLYIKLIHGRSKQLARA